MLPVSPVHRGRLGLPDAIANPHVANGAGALRALVFEVRGDLRPAIEAAAGALAARPALLWMLVGMSRDGATAIAAVDSSGSRARVASLTLRQSSIVASDAETACALAAAVAGPDLLIHLRWLEILGRDAVGTKFFRTLAAKVDQLAGSLSPSPRPGTARRLALICSSRLLFLSFLETRGWLDGDRGFLANGFGDCMARGGNYHRKVLSPLFFGTLNTPPRSRACRARAFGRVPFLNGGLFARSAEEKEHSKSSFSDEALGDFYGDLLMRFRFTAREDSRSWSESAIDPEMLGKAFEGLMDSSVRRKSGAFYTPQSLVADLTSSALVHALQSDAIGKDEVAAALRGDRLPAALCRPLAERIDSLRILDPACGSGAFLVHALEQVSRCRLLLDDTESLHRVRRRMLTTSVFGVDVNPMAVWLCELRLWLSMAIEDPETNPMRVTPLPNLDRNIRVGDSLGADDFSLTTIPDTARRIARLRMQYSRASGSRKKNLARVLDSTERLSIVTTVARRIDRLAGERREALAAGRARDLFGGRALPDPRAAARLSVLRQRLNQSREELRRLRSGGALPFSFPGAFADVCARGGFDVVIGNPPWIRTHNLDAESRSRLKRNFAVYSRAAWRGGADAAAAGSGFAAQVDSAALFIERSLSLTRQSGIVAMIVPAKLWRSLAGGGVRELLLGTTALLQVHDLTLADTVFDASVYPSTFVSRKIRSPTGDCVEVMAHNHGQTQAWRSRPQRVAFDHTPGSPWLLVPERVRAGFDRLSHAGSRLSESPFRRPMLGVKTGCNEAFIIDRGIAQAHGLSLTRKVIRGESVRAWSLDPEDARIVWTHDSGGNPLARLPAEEAKWLGRFRRKLELRTDARGSRWWSLFRTDSADFSRPRVVWADIGRTLRAAVIPAGDSSVPLNTCYVVRCPTMCDAFALAALMNSDVISSWLSILAEPARGGYRRYMGWTIALMPIPADWNRACALLAPLGELAYNGAPPDPADLRAAAVTAFGIDEACVEPLIEWITG